MGAAPRSLSWAGNVHCLLNLGRVSGKQLLGKPKRGRLPVSILFSGIVWRVAARDFRTQTGVVAGLVIVFAGAPGLVGARRVQTDLLLLSRRLLQSFLGRPARLRSGRAKKRVPW